MGRNKEHIRWAPQHLGGQGAMCPKPATRQNCKCNIVDWGAGGTDGKRGNAWFGITVEPPDVITGFGELKQVPDDLQGIPFSAGAMSAQGTRNVYANKHICDANPSFSETDIACILVLW